MTISYGIGKYVLAFGVLLSAWGFYRNISNTSGSSNVAATFAILFGVPIAIAGLLFMMIARQRRAQDEFRRKQKLEQEKKQGRH